MELSEDNQEARNIQGEEKQEAMMIEEKQEAMTILLRSVKDKFRYTVEEEVALAIPSIRARIKIYNTKFKPKTKPPKKLICDIEFGITKGSLEIVVKYMYNLLYPSEHVFDFEAEFLKLEPYSIFNLILASYSLKIKNLMVMTCQRLVYKVMTDVKNTREIYSKRKMVLQKDANPRKTLKWTDSMSPSGSQDSEKYCSTYMLPGGAQDSGRDCIPVEKPIFRDCLIDNFVNESYFVDVHLSPMVIELSYIGHWVNRLESTFEKHLKEVRKFVNLEQSTRASVNSTQLKTAILRLEEIIVGDPRFSSCLRDHVVFFLAKILKTTAYGIDIQRAVVSILSHADLKTCCYVMEAEVVPVLADLVSESTGELFDVAVSALTRLAYMFPDRIGVIVDDNTFGDVCKAFSNPNLNKYWLSKFLAAICRGYRLSSGRFPSDKVEAVLSILESYQFTTTTNEDIHVFMCYALLHLSDGRSVPLAWNNLIERLIGLIYIRNTLPTHSTSLEYGSRNVLIIGALGVIGNFIKWGSSEQIEYLITETELLPSLRRLLSSEIKKFRVEGSRIISTLAARRTISVEIVNSGVVDCLCELLLNENSEVKLDAAWAVINSMYGFGDHRKIDKCLEMEQAK